MAGSTIFWRGVLVASVAVMLAGCGLALWLLWRSRLKPYTRNSLLVLLALALLVGGLFIRTWSGGLSPFMAWLWNLEREYALGTMFSTMLFVMIGLTALLIGVYGRFRQGWHRIWWLVLAAGFVFLGLDEYFQIHELIIGEDRWRILYVGAAGALGLASGWVYRRVYPQETRFFALFFTGLVVMAISGIVVEYAVWSSFCYETPDSLVPVCDPFSQYLFFEEYFEVIGVLMVLAAVLYFAQQHLTERGWNIHRRALPLGGAAVFGGLVAYLWLLPAVEARLWAVPVQVDYDGGNLSLIGYRLSSEAAGPGKTVDISLYWRANEVPAATYGISLHALEQPTLDETAAQYDDINMGQYPSRAFLPGSIVRKNATLTLPEAVTAPASYRLMLRVWSGKWETQDLTGLEIRESELPLLTPDSLLFGSVAVVPETALPPAQHPADYHFAGGARLTGYDLPDTAAPGEALPLRFAWRTDAALTQNLTQFVHLLDADSGELVFGYDSAPFAGRFPTADWPAGVQMQDPWHIPLPDDLPEGTYEVRTGLYDAVTVARIAVQDGQGQPVQDYSIALGSVQINR